MPEDSNIEPQGLESIQFIRNLKNKDVYGIDIQPVDFIKFLHRASDEISSEEDRMNDEAMQYTDFLGMYTTISVGIVHLLQQEHFSSFTNATEQDLRQKQAFSKYSVLSVGGTESKIFHLFGSKTVSVSPGFPEMNPTIQLPTYKEKMSQAIIDNGTLAKNAFDIVITSRVFEQQSGMPDEEMKPAADAIIEVLKPGGVLIQQTQRTVDDRYFGTLIPTHRILVPTTHVMFNEIVSVREKPKD